ncbi:beta-ketoacyl synthase N-terminal-like domain-containing protein [Streptomyces sp. NPDC048278]|uniref:polyketide synthase n=1 Tax=Streptomyces sp. NPDC048278 TaxID=3155809 RepID=UPI003417411B
MNRNVVKGFRSEEIPVAVIGMACRTSAGEDSRSLWDLLSRAECAIKDVPPERLPSIDPGPVAAEPMRAALLEDPAAFDAEFFRISRRMAAWMDPHQRTLLELTWHALEDAAIAPHTLCGTDVAVFAAAGMSDYRERMVAAGRVDGAALPGTLMAFVANRISHQFDWTGPSYVMDAACASGLSVLAPAMTGLRTREFPLAAVMAANITTNGFYTSSAYRTGALSPTGRSVPFSGRHDGYIRGDGAACLILKRLDDALADGDPVQAVIRGIALAHNGRAGGLTGSASEPQSRLLTRVARASGVPLHSLGHLEAHGTGTSGDRSEIQGLAAALAGQEGGQRPAGGPGGRLWVGTLKANIGHLEMAAGLLGVVKSVLILRHGLIPAIPGLQGRDPAIDWGDVPIALADHPVPWPANGDVRRLAVNSFGIGGAIACALLEDAPDRPAPTAGYGPLPVPISAGCPDSLRLLAAGLERSLTDEDPGRLPALARTLQTGRDGLAERRVLVADAPHRLRDALTALAAGRRHPAVAADGDSAALTALAPGAATAAARWLSGGDTAWPVPPGPGPVRLSGLPGHPFRRRHHWFDTRRPMN